MKLKPQRDKGGRMGLSYIGGMTENFPNVVKDINSQIHEAQHTPGRRNTKKIILRHNTGSS